jgi:hypothetical protein
MYPAFVMAVYNFRLMEADALGLGLTQDALARRTKPRITQQSISRAFKNQSASPRTAKAIAAGLGRSLRRYVITDTQAVDS